MNYEISSPDETRNSVDPTNYEFAGIPEDVGCTEAPVVSDEPRDGELPVEDAGLVAATVRSEDRAVSSEVRVQVEVPGASEQIEAPRLEGVNDRKPDYSDPETLRNTLYKELGAGAASKSVVVGSAAAGVAFGSEFIRPSHDLDVAVDEKAYRALRERVANQGEWTEVRLPDGRAMLRKVDCTMDVACGWGETSQDELWGRKWDLRVDGTVVPVANITDVIDFKDRRASPEDLEDLDAIKAAQQDPERPRPKEQLRYEMDVVRSCLPEHMRDDPNLQIGIEQAANGLQITNFYGDKDTGRVRQIHGELEKPEYGVRAFYHNGIGLPEDMKDIVKHYMNVNADRRKAGLPIAFSDEEIVDTVAAESYADTRFGGGRGVDERESAELFAGHATKRDFSPERIQASAEAIEDTTFNEDTKAQKGATSKSPRSRALVAVDLQTLGRRCGLRAGDDLALEDKMSDRGGKDRPFGKAVARHGVRLHTAREGYSFLDEHPEEVAAREAVIDRQAGTPKFMRAYRAPEGWTLEDREQQLASAGVGERLIELARQEDITMVEGYDLKVRFEKGEDIGPEIGLR